jgi:hypothetical protein
VDGVTKRRPERFALRVIKGALQPADSLTEGRLRAKGYSVGDIVFAEIKKPRRPRFHRLAHAFGQMVADNIEEFEGMDPHKVLKRLQWESGVGCETIGARVPGVGFVEVRIPQSLAFESMDDGEFAETFRGLARHVAETYWPDLSPEEIEQMAEVMPGEVA